MADVRVNRRLVIPEYELDERFTTSSGPGGQHANKASTRAELVWNVASSGVLGARQKERILGKLRHRIDKDGNLRLAAETHRSQLRNRAEVRDRLASLVDEALRVERPRVATKPTRASVDRRVQAKRRRSEVKKMRRSPPEE